MKKLLLLTAALLALTPGATTAAPVTVTNQSMELPALAAGGWSNALNTWTGTLGNNNGSAFTEYITGFNGGGNQHLGMALGYDVWQDLTGVTYQAATEYTLRVAVGNRAGSTDATNDSQYALAQGGVGTTQTLYGTNGSKNASQFAAGTFGDAPPLSMNTTTFPAAVGQTIRVLVRSRGVNRSHFDNIRLTRTSPGTLTHGTPVPLASTATVPVTITDNGDSASFTGTVYYGLTDGGTTAGSWSNSVTLGTALATGATVNGQITGLTPGNTYFFRAKGTNFAGDSWAPAAGSFVTSIPSLPSLQNDAASAVATHSAQLNGQVLTNGGDPPTIITYWGTADGGTSSGSWQFSANLGVKVIGAFNNTITGLSHSTTYYFRSTATNASGTVWSPATLSVTTLTVTPPSALVIQAPIGTTGYTALLNGRVVDPGNEAPDVTIYWGAADGGTTPGNWANSVTQAARPGAFGHLANNLAPNTTYYWRARSVNTNGTSWAPATITFTTNTKLPIFINEIHYDPADHTKRVEFIELWNPSTTPIVISGWKITGPADFTFANPTIIAANSYIVVAENPAVLTANYTVGGTLLGPWSGVLSNGSGHIVLRDATYAQVDDADYRQGFPWPTLAAGGGASAELINPGLENDVGGSWRSSAPLPTPGRINSVYANVTGPGISNVDHAAVAVPAQGLVVKSGQDVKVTAYVDDRNGVAGVALEYQIVNPGSYIPRYLQTNPATFTPALNPAYNTGWVPLPMTDDATGGDAVASDNIYTVTVPASLAVHRRLMRYRIVATDGLGTTRQAPYSDDENPNFAWFVYDGAPGWSGAFRPASITTPVVGSTAIQNYSASLINSIEPFHLISSDADVLNCQYSNSSSLDRPFPGTFVYKGKVYDNVFYKNRGIGSTYNTGKNKWAIKFNRARDFQAFDNWGRPYKETWNSMSLDANAYPWAALFRGAAGIEEAASYRAHELAGSPSLRTSYAHLRVIRRAQESAVAGTLVTESLGTNFDGQYSSDLFGLYMVLEPTEGNFLGERNLPDGNLYAIEGNNGDQKFQAYSQPTVTDWNTFRTDLGTGGQTEAWYRANMDLPALYNFMALGRLLGNVDVRPGDNYRFYHRSSDNRWVILAYDLDMMCIAGTHWAGTIDGIIAGAAPHAIQAIKRHPAIALEYRNRCREIMSLMASDASLTGGQMGQLMDEYAQMVNPAGVALTWADLDAAMWNFHPRTSGNSNPSGQNNARANFFRATFADGPRGGLGGSIQTASWLRSIPDPDLNGIGDHEGLTQWFVNYATNTFPATTRWTRRATNAGPFFGGAGTDTDVNRQKGYGYKYLEWESLHGGWFNCTTNPPATTAIGDLTAAGIDRYYAGDSLATLASGNLVLYPHKPTATYAGTAGYPVNDVQIQSSDYAAPAGGGSVAAVQFRIGEISAPGIPLYDPTQPRIYELESVWTSAEIATASPTGIPAVKVPVSAMRPGHTYRARVRHRDATGRWSFWSEPMQFVPSAPDLTVYQNVLRVSEINYHPGIPTPPELASAGWNPAWDEEDFEFIEVRNISAFPQDMTDIRFTKGVDFDFAPGFTIPAGGYAVLVKTPAAFAIRYPGVAIAGTYGTANLSNAGEEVKLSYGAGVAIVDFTYDDIAPWPSAPDGTGPTLVLRTPAKPGLDHNDATEWRASYLPNGNPGGSDGYTFNIWAASHPGIGNRDADDDYDGFSNRLEYALFGDPNSYSASLMPTAQFSEVSGLTYATLTYTRRSEAEDTVFSVQFSDELMTWNIPGVMVSSTSNGNGTQTEVWRSTDPVSTRARLFGRVQVTTTP